MLGDGAASTARNGVIPAVNRSSVSMRRLHLEEEAAQPLRSDSHRHDRGPSVVAGGRFKSNGEALAAAAFALDVGITEAERLVQALADEIHLGAIEKGEALAVDDDLDAMVLEHQVGALHVIGIVDDVG